MQKHLYSLADAVGTVAIVAVVALGGAGGLAAEAGGVLGRRYVPCAGNGLGQGRGDFVLTHDQVDLLVSVEDAGHAVAVAVNVDDLPLLGEGVDGGEIDGGVPRLLQHLGGGVSLLGMPVPEDAIAFLKAVVKIHIPNGDRAADPDGGVADGGTEIGGCLAGLGKDADLVAASDQIFF